MAGRKSSKQAGPGCLALFGLPFLLAGLAMTWLYWAGMLDWLRARSWVETPCVIEAVSRAQGDDTTRTNATFSYRFRGREYRSERVSFYKGGDNVGDFQEKAYRELSRHRGGKPFSCHVNPADPSEAVLYRTLRWPMQAFLAVFVLTFPAVGGGLVIAGLLGARTSRREARLRGMHPDEPWMARTIWQGTVIPESGGATHAAVAGYTLWAGLMIFPMLAVVAASGAFEEDPKAWLLMIYPLLWCAPAYAWWRGLRRRWTLGGVRFELPRRPVRGGEVMEGHLLLAKPMPVRSEAELELLCEEVTTHRTSDGTSTRTRKIWSRSETVPDEELVRDVSGFRLPVRFEVPADAPDGTLADPAGTRHVWKLVMRVTGLRDKAEFELPVVKAAEGTLMRPETTLMEGPPQPGDLEEHLRERKIPAEFGRDGTPVRLDFPPARHLGTIIALFVFLAVWTAASVFLIIKEAPWLFRIVWPASCVLMAAWWIWMVLHRRRVDLEPDALVIRHRFGPIGWVHRLGKGEIAAFDHGSNMSSGNTRFYRVRARGTGGKWFTIADGLTEQALAAELQRRLEAWWKR